MTFNDLTSDQQATADALVRGLRATYAAGQDNVDDYGTGAYLALGGRIEHWAIVLRANAERGTRDDGSPYTLVDWANYGKELGSDISFYSHLTPDPGLYDAVAATTSQTASDILTGGQSLWSETSGGVSSLWKKATDLFSSKPSSPSGPPSPSGPSRPNSSGPSGPAISPWLVGGIAGAVLLFAMRKK